MKYTTSDYISDNLGVLSDLADLISALKKKSKILYKKLLEIDYYYHTVKILQSLPEAFIIIYLGFLSIYSLLKYTESSYGNKIYPIITTSMAPEINPGSLVFTTNTQKYKKGDIVSYVEKSVQGVSTGKVLTHRIIALENDGKYLTKGDANPDADPVAVAGSQIRGKVSLVIPLLGYLEVLIKTIPGFLVLVVAPAIYLIKGQLKEVGNIIRE